MFRLFRRWRHRRAPKAAILRYHRVADLGSDPYGYAVSPAHFAEHLTVLRERLSPAPLEQVVAGGSGVAVTFDDGYRDVLDTARPMLERARVPATVFVVTSMIDAAREFWWDALERLFPAPARPPDALHARLKALDEPERTALVDRLLAEAGIDPAPRADRRTLGAGEISARRDDPWLTVGAHTVSHPMLSRLTPARQWEEISGSKQVLDRLLGKPVTAFAYPYGAGARLGDMVKRAGFQCACTTRTDRVFPGDDRYRLPRIYVGNWPGAELARRLDALGL